jgi:hypothetical protein
MERNFNGETGEMINKHSNEDAIMVSDVGQQQMFTCHIPNLNNLKVMCFWRIGHNGICSTSCHWCQDGNAKS